MSPLISAEATILMRLSFKIKKTKSIQTHLGAGDDIDKIEFQKEEAKI